MIQVPEKTSEDLQWGRLLEHLADRCRGPVAREAALALSPLQEDDQLTERLDRVSEARGLIDRGRLPPLSTLSDVTEPSAIAARGGVLDAIDLYEIGGVLETAWRCRRFFADEATAEAYPALAARAQALAELPDLARQLLESFDERGEVVDSATPDLARMRSRVTRMHEGLKEEVHGLLANEEYVGLLQDEYVTLRDDRYVLPIKAGHKSHVSGVIHGWSASGQTVYIEPQSVVEANNRLSMAQAEVDREIRRLLQQLSSSVGDYAGAIAETVQSLAVIDLAMAAGELSRGLDAVRPVIADEPRLVLEAARHPLLTLSGVEVISNRIELDDGRRVLVITGPNTGGKTVALKTAGICTLMALSGLHIPADPGSVVPRVPGVFSDIGDAQSLDRALSTFSGHITNIVEILGDIAPGSLVLLDELMVGTDPGQGAALAQALLEHLADHHVLTLVTTHYESLKALPFTDQRFRNGAMGFDVDKLVPTWKLRMDVPGASSALRTARRLGVTEGIVDRATTLAGRGQQGLEAVITELEREAAAARRDRAEAAAARSAAEAARLAAEQHERKLRNRLREGVARERDAALREARALRDEVNALRASLKDERIRRDEAALEAQQKKTQAVIDGVLDAQAEAARAAAGPAAPASALKPGQKVWVVSLGTTGEVLSAPDARGRCEVRAGLLTARVPTDDLRIGGKKGPSAAGRKPGKPAPKPEPAPRPPEVDWEDAPPQVSHNTVDLRGLRVDEALEKAERFLDLQIERGSPIAFLIHGHGTGALKREIRTWLRHTGYVRAQRPGDRHEGGDGVTAVLLS